MKTTTRKKSSTRKPKPKSNLQSSVVFPLVLGAGSFLTFLALVWPRKKTNHPPAPAPAPAPIAPKSSPIPLPPPPPPPPPPESAVFDQALDDLDELNYEAVIAKYPQLTDRERDVLAYISSMVQYIDDESNFEGLFEDEEYRTLTQAMTELLESLPKIPEAEYPQWLEEAYRIWRLRYPETYKHIKKEALSSARQVLNFSFSPFQGKTPGAQQKQVTFVYEKIRDVLDSDEYALLSPLDRDIIIESVLAIYSEFLADPTANEEEVAEA